jgi:cytochrome P450
MTWPPFLIPWMRLDAGRFSPWGRALAKRREADAMLFSEIRARREGGGPKKDDILSLLLAARDEDGQPMSDDELRDELVTLLVAGHETTATALSWAVRWILADADVEAKLRDELGGAADLTPQRIQALPYLDACAREALRLNPIIPIVGRITTRDLSLGGYELAKGTGIVCSIYLAQRRPDVFPDPTRFDPERFLEGAPGRPSGGRRIAPYEFFPFGGGIRRCIGMAFALLEMKMVLARLFTRTTMKLESPSAIGYERRSITLVPSEGLRVRLVERSPRAARVAA